MLNCSSFHLRDLLLVTQSFFLHNSETATYAWKLLFGNAIFSGCIWTHHKSLACVRQKCELIVAGQFRGAPTGLLQHVRSCLHLFFSLQLCEILSLAPTMCGRIRHSSSDGALIPMWELNPTRPLCHYVQVDELKRNGSSYAICHSFDLLQKAAPPRLFSTHRKENCNFICCSLPPKLLRVGSLEPSYCDDNSFGIHSPANQACSSNVLHVQVKPKFREQENQLPGLPFQDHTHSLVKLKVRKLCGNSNRKHSAHHSSCKRWSKKLQGNHDSFYEHNEGSYDTGKACQNKHGGKKYTNSEPFALLSSRTKKQRLECCQISVCADNPVCENGVCKVGEASSSLTTEFSAKANDGEGGMAERQVCQTWHLPWSASGLLTFIFFSLLSPGACSSGGSGIGSSWFYEKVLSFLNTVIQFLDPGVVCGVVVLIVTLLLLLYFTTSTSRSPPNNSSSVNQAPEEEQSRRPGSSLKFSSSHGSTIVTAVQCTDRAREPTIPSSWNEDASRRNIGTESDKDDEHADKTDVSQPDTHAFMVSYQQHNDSSIAQYSTNAELICSSSSDQCSSNGVQQHHSIMVGLPVVKDWQGQLAHPPPSHSSLFGGGPDLSGTEGYVEAACNSVVDPHGMKTSICSAEEKSLFEAPDFLNPVQPSELSPSGGHYQVPPINPFSFNIHPQNQRLNLPSYSHVQVVEGSIPDIASTGNVNVPCDGSLFALNCYAESKGFADEEIKFSSVDTQLSFEDCRTLPSDVEQEGSIFDSSLKTFVVPCECNTNFALEFSEH